MLNQMTSCVLSPTVPMVISYSGVPETAMPETAGQQPANLVQIDGYWMVQRSDYRWGDEPDGWPPFNWPNEQTSNAPTPRRETATGPQFLQIATGRWVASEHATKFLGREAAEAYAEEYGLDFAGDVQVFRRFQARAFLEA